jgi:predicted dehydrogenase
MTDPAISSASSIPVGLVGCGLISTAHLRAWASTPGFHVAGVFDVDPASAARQVKEFGVERTFSTVDELIARCAVIDICTPPQTHAAIAGQAVASGRHLVIEKPVVTRLGDWEKLSTDVAARGVAIAVIHNLKFLNAVQQAKAWVDEGRIGRILRMQRWFMTSPKTDRMLVADGHWSHSLPGGRWFETLPHELYLTHYFIGPLDLANVVALRTRHAPSGAPADEVQITLRGDDVISTIHFSASCDQNRRLFTIQGTDGHIEVDILSDFASLSTQTDGKWKRFAGRSLLDAGTTVLRAAADRGAYAVKQIRRDHAHARIIQALGRHLTTGSEAPTPFAEIDYVIRNCDTIGREIDRQIGLGG